MYHKNYYALYSYSNFPSAAIEILLSYYYAECSAFHLSYNMLLNQILHEDSNPENLLRNSFYQFQADRAIPDLEVS